MLIVTRQEKKLMKKETCMMKDGRPLGGNVRLVILDELK